MNRALLALFGDELEELEAFCERLRTAKSVTPTDLRRLRAAVLAARGAKVAVDEETGIEMVHELVVEYMANAKRLSRDDAAAIFERDLHDRFDNLDVDGGRASELLAAFFSAPTLSKDLGYLVQPDGGDKPKDPKRTAFLLLRTGMFGPTSARARVYSREEIEDAKVEAQLKSDDTKKRSSKDDLLDVMTRKVRRVLERRREQRTRG